MDAESIKSALQAKNGVVMDFKLEWDAFRFLLFDKVFAMLGQTAGADSYAEATAAGGCLVSRGVCVYNRGLLYEQGALDQCTIRSGLPGFVDGPHGEELYRLSVYADKETAAAYCRESSAYLVL